MQSTSHVKSINGVIKKDLNGQCVSLNELCASLTRFLKERQNNKEFIAWKKSIPLISLPNIYNTIQEISILNFHVRIDVSMKYLIYLKDVQMRFLEIFMIN